MRLQSFLFSFSLSCHLVSPIENNIQYTDIFGYTEHRNHYTFFPTYFEGIYLLVCTSLLKVWEYIYQLLNHNCCFEYPPLHINYIHFSDPFASSLGALLQCSPLLTSVISFVTTNITPFHSHSYYTTQTHPQKKEEEGTWGRRGGKMG